MNPLRILCLLICVVATYQSTAQEVSLSFDRASLTTVFQRIEEQTGYTSWITKQQLRRSRPVTIHVVRRPLSEVLQTIFANQPLDFTLIEHNIVVKDEPPTKSPQANTANQENSARHLQGRVTDSLHQPLSEVSVLNLQTGQFVLSDQQGHFKIVTDSGQTLQLSYVGMETVMLTVRSSSPVQIILKMRNTEEAAVIFRSGYEAFTPDRAVGAYSQIGSILLSRSASPNLDERLTGLPGGIVFTRINHNEGSFSVRSRNTIFANEQPLIILDKFPFEEDIRLINPTDIESVTILKDAAATSVWGARAANGVLVITTKKGRYQQQGQFSVTVNHNIALRPSLDKQPALSSKDAIEIETFLFEQGEYDQAINTPYVALSPVVSFLLEHQQGSLSTVELKRKFDSLGRIDQRKESMRYYYRPSNNRQYAINYSDGNTRNQYYVSLGLDANNLQLAGSRFERGTAAANYSHKTAGNRLTLSASGLLTLMKDLSGGEPAVLWPYQSWIDEKGKHEAVYPYRRQWLDTIAAGKLQDWSLSPLDELTSNSSRLKEVFSQLTAEGIYTIQPGWQLSFTGQFSHVRQQSRIVNEANSFKARDLVNQFSQVNDQGQLVSPVPAGAMLEHAVSHSTALNGRLQLNYKSRWTGDHSLSAIAGGEVRDHRYRFNASRTLGYGTAAATDTFNYAIEYPRIFFPGSSGFVAVPTEPNEYRDRFLSAFATASYGFKGRYIVSGSLRKDASNLFGAEANRKGLPLWSAGGSWHISREGIFTNKIITSWRFRATFGTSGNVDKNVFALTTINTGLQNVFFDPYAPLVNPPNANLKWEQVFTANYGMDLRLWDDRVMLNVDLYFRRASDLTADGPLPPSSGVSIFRGNLASMRGRGWEFQLQTLNKLGPLGWESSLNINYNKDWITRFWTAGSPLGFHTGYPYSAIFAYRWAGLNQQGNPQGYRNGQVSTDWETLINTDSLGNNTQYIGTEFPKFYGNWMHTVTCGRLSFSLNVVFKLGYYIRMPSVNYSELFQNLKGTADFSNRWKQPGDELQTSVPAMIYPASRARDDFYNGAAHLVKPADHVRLLDARITYNFGENKSRKQFAAAKLYLYARNLGVIWSAAGGRFDPEPFPDTPLPVSLNLGFQTTF